MGTVVVRYRFFRWVDGSRRRGVQRLTSDIRGRRQRMGSEAAAQVQQHVDQYGAGQGRACKVGMRRARMCSVSGMR